MALQGKARRGRPAHLRLVEEPETLVMLADRGTSALARLVAAGDRLDLERGAAAARDLQDFELRWAGVRLLAERRYGELLGPAERGGDRRSSSLSEDDLTPPESKQRHHARKVAAVDEERFA